MNVFEQFGCRKIINASGKMTALGASAVRDEVGEALKRAAMDYVDISELLDQAGKVIARVTGAEAGCPTLGASAGIAISVAATIAGMNLTLIERIPNTEGLANEVILQKGHAVNFGASVSQMIAVGGGKVVEVGQANQVAYAHLEEAVNERTAALMYVKSHHAVQKGMQPIEAMIKAGKAKNIPVIIDAAAEEDLKKYIQMGADLVIYSGGKAIEGPTSGLICGRKDLVQACRAQYQGVGRAMKASKEAIIGLLTALEQYDLRSDESEAQRKRMEKLVAQFEGIEGVAGSIVQDEAGRAIYRAQLKIDEKIIGIKVKDIIKQLEAGNPAIFTRNHYANVGILFVDPRPLLAGQEDIIAERIKEVIRH